MAAQACKVDRPAHSPSLQDREREGFLPRHRYLVIF